MLTESFQNSLRHLQLLAGFAFDPFYLKSVCELGRPTADAVRKISSYAGIVRVSY
jgi:hypothetical protein